MPNQYVVASRSFQYAPDMRVSRGQVFNLKGLINDPLLLKYGHVRQYEGTAESVKKLPTCLVCGAVFEYEYLRDRHAEVHEMSAAERKEAQRQRAHRSYERRVLQVGD
ncbi:MAG: hypothetical protein JXB35_10415 [Anaerolineae bacterium]|nr:hypothetical protein [Anaerolineae bacterium]